MTDKTQEAKLLDDELEHLIETLRSMDLNDPEYQLYLDRYEQLSKLRKEPEKEPEKKSWWTPEVILPIAGNLLGIFAILSYEKINVISTKALGFVMKR